LYQILIVAVIQLVLLATRITLMLSFVSILTCFLYSFVVIYIKRLRPGMILGTLLWMFAGGLMYHFRGGSDAESGILAAKFVVELGTGSFSDEITVIIQNHILHEEVARVTAMGHVLYWLGGAFGATVSGAIRMQIAPATLERRLGNSTVAAEF
jgi:SIT family siderophore-iron:H+ symporter-like MFS transporter